MYSAFNQLVFIILCSHFLIMKGLCSLFIVVIIAIIIAIIICRYVYGDLKLNHTSL